MLSVGLYLYMSRSSLAQIMIDSILKVKNTRILSHHSSSDHDERIVKKMQTYINVPNQLKSRIPIVIFVIFAIQSFFLLKVRNVYFLFKLAKYLKELLTHLNKYAYHYTKHLESCFYRIKGIIKGYGYFSK